MTIKEKVQSLITACQAATGIEGDLTQQVAALVGGSVGQSGWSYNGVVLPALPEWDREKYPVACISRMGEKYPWELKVFPSYKYETYNGKYRVGYTAPHRSWQSYDATNSNYTGEWTGGNEFTTEAWMATVGSDYILWTNRDILYEGGTVATPASDPVPVNGGTLSLEQKVQNLINACKAKTGIEGDLTVQIGALVSPSMYSYNGVVLPKLPEWDKETYPYVALMPFGGVYAMSEKIEYEAKAFGSQLHIPYPYLYAGFDMYGNFNAWELNEGDGSSQYKVYYGLPEWSNHDILQTGDGTVFLSASEPVGMYTPITLYDGEITLSQPDYMDNACGSVQLKGWYKIGDVLEITLNGNTATYTATTADTYNGVLVGNNGLNGNDPDGVDDGGDILLTYPHLNGDYVLSYIYIRTPGTHQVTIELLSTGG